MNNELQNSIKYIKEKTGSDSGFSIPENYFNGIEDDFLIKLSEEKLPNTSSFDTPGNYFDNLENDILSKIDTTPKQGKVISLKSRLFKYLPTAVAASLVLFLSFQFLNTKETTSIDDISYADIEDWFEENNTNTELAFVYEDNLDENDLTLTDVNFSDETIEDYLNSVDHSDLLNEIQ